jgi:hypothetical protein
MYLDWIEDDEYFMHGHAPDGDGPVAVVQTYLVTPPGTPWHWSFDNFLEITPDNLFADSYHGWCATKEEARRAAEDAYPSADEQRRVQVLIEKDWELYLQSPECLAGFERPEE